MDCEQFEQRMHERLDHRLSLEGDTALSDHAHRCDSCRRQLEAWRQVSAILPGCPSPDVGVTSRRDAATGGRSVGRRVAVLSGLAAAILLASAVFWDSFDAEPPSIVQSVAVNENPEVVVQSMGQLDPVGWWRSVQDRDWVGQTMPAVKSVQEGVAPLGRSLRRAVTILTIGGRNQTS